MRKIKATARLSDELRKSLKGDRGEMGPVGFGKDGMDGLDGANGKDGINPTPEEVATLVLMDLPHPKLQLEELKGEERLDVSAIKGIDDVKLSDDIFNRAVGILDQRTNFLINKINNLPSSSGLDTVAGDLRYLKLDTSNDPLTGSLAWSSTLNNGTPISFANTDGITKTVHTMHVGGGDNTGGLGEFNTFNVEMTPNTLATSTAAIVQFVNFEGFYLTSGMTASSFIVQEINQATTPVWTFGADEPINFTSTGALTLLSTPVGDEVVVTVTCTSTAGVGTCTTVSGNHNLATGDFVLIAGANEAGYNGYVSIHRTSATVFTYPVIASTASPATGTITATDRGTGLIQFSQSGLATNVTTDTAFLSTGGVNIFRMDSNGFSTTNATTLLSAPGSIFFGTLETVAPASLTEPLAFFNILAPTMTGRIAQTTFIARIDNSGTTSITIPTGTSASIGGVMIDAPRFIMTGTSTDSATLYIAGAPTKTSGAGTLGNARPLWVDSGISRFDDGIILGGNTGVTSSATTGGVWTIAGTGNTNNENITLDFETVANEVKLGTGTGVTSFKFDVQPSVKAGTSTSYASFGGALTETFTDTTVGGAEADIYSYTTPASVLGANGDKLIASYGGNFVTVGTELTQLKVYFGGTAIWDSTGVAVATGTTSWRVYAEIVRVSSTVVRYSVSLNTTGASGFVYCTVGELTGLTLSNTNILKLTGTSSGVGSGSGDIIGKMSYVNWLPA